MADLVDHTDQGAPAANVVEMAANVVEMVVDLCHHGEFQMAGEDIICAICHAPAATILQEQPPCKHPRLHMLDRGETSLEEWLKKDRFVCAECDMEMMDVPEEGRVTSIEAFPIGCVDACVSRIKEACTLVHQWEQTLFASRDMGALHTATTQVEKTAIAFAKLACEVLYIAIFVAGDRFHVRYLESGANVGFCESSHILASLGSSVSLLSICNAEDLQRKSTHDFPKRRKLQDHTDNREKLKQVIDDMGKFNVVHAVIFKVKEGSQNFRWTFPENFLQSGSNQSDPSATSMEVSPSHTTPAPMEAATDPTNSTAMEIDPLPSATSAPTSHTTPAPMEAATDPTNSTAMEIDPLPSATTTTTTTITLTATTATTATMDDTPDHTNALHETSFPELLNAEPDIFAFVASDDDRHEHLNEGIEPIAQVSNLGPDAAATVKSLLNDVRAFCRDILNDRGSQPSWQRVCTFEDKGPLTLAAQMYLISCFSGINARVKHLSDRLTPKERISNNTAMRLSPRTTLLYGTDILRLPPFDTAVLIGTRIQDDCIANHREAERANLAAEHPQNDAQQQEGWHVQEDDQEGQQQREQLLLTQGPQLQGLQGQPEVPYDDPGSPFEVRSDDEQPTYGLQQEQDCVLDQLTTIIRQYPEFVQLVQIRDGFTWMLPDCELDGANLRLVKNTFVELWVSDGQWTCSCTSFKNNTRQFSNQLCLHQRLYTVSLKYLQERLRAAQAVHFPRHFIHVQESYEELLLRPPIHVTVISVGEPSTLKLCVTTSTESGTNTTMCHISHGAGILCQRCGGEGSLTAPDAGEKWCSHVKILWTIHNDEDGAKVDKVATHFPGIRALESSDIIAGRCVDLKDRIRDFLSSKVKPGSYAEELEGAPSSKDESFCHKGREYKMKAFSAHKPADSLKHRIERGEYPEGMTNGSTTGLSVVQPHKIVSKIIGTTQYFGFLGCGLETRADELCGCNCPWDKVEDGDFLLFTLGYPVIHPIHKLVCCNGQCKDVQFTGQDVFVWCSSRHMGFLDSVFTTWLFPALDAQKQADCFSVFVARMRENYASTNKTFRFVSTATFTDAFLSYFAALKINFTAPCQGCVAMGYRTSPITGYDGVSGGPSLRYQFDEPYKDLTQGVKPRIGTAFSFTPLGNKTRDSVTASTVRAEIKALCSCLRAPTEKPVMSDAVLKWLHQVTVKTGAADSAAQLDQLFRELMDLIPGSEIALASAALFEHLGFKCSITQFMYAEAVDHLERLISIDWDDGSALGAAERGLRMVFPQCALYLSVMRKYEDSRMKDRLKIFVRYVLARTSAVVDFMKEKDTVVDADFEKYPDSYDPPRFGAAFSHHETGRQCRPKRDYAQDDASTPAEHDCSKPSFGKRSGRYCLFLETCLLHGSIVGFQYSRAEGRKDVMFASLLYRERVQCVLCYDFGCQACGYVLSREPVYFLPGHIFMDRFHQLSHTDCESPFHLNRFDSHPFNSSLMEHVNSRLASFLPTIRSMGKLRSVFLTQVVIHYLNIQAAQTLRENQATASVMSGPASTDVSPEVAHGIFYVPSPQPNVAT